MQDRRGYLWFGTFGGISRFNGKNFVNYDIKEGLPSKYCDEIIEDKKGRLWIATRRGLSMFGGKKFTNYQHPDSNYASYIGHLNEGKDGYIRFLLGVNGKNAMCRVKSGVIVKDVHPKGFQDSSLSLYLLLENGTAIFRAPHSGYILYPDGRLQVLPEIKYKYAKVLLKPGEPNSFYYASESGVFYRKNGISTKINNLSFKDQILTAFYIDWEGRLWLADDRGVYVLSPNGSQVFFIDGHKELPGYLVPSIFQDKQGTHWICTFRGLVKATDKYVQHFRAEDGLRDTDILSSGRLTNARFFWAITL